MVSHPALQALSELQAGTLTAESLDVLRRGAACYLRSGAALTLDRALRLPTARQFRRLERDYAIAQALRLLPGATAHERAALLRRRLAQMAERGTWARWHAAGGPPRDASELQRHAFTVLSSGRMPGSPAVPSLSLLRLHAAESEC